MATSINPWLVGPQYWVGWQALSWQTSWGYDSGGNPIEVYVPEGVSSSDGDDEDPIVEHAKAKGEAESIFEMFKTFDFVLGLLDFSLLDT